MLKSYYITLHLSYSTCSHPIEHQAMKEGIEEGIDPDKDGYAVD